MEPLSIVIIVCGVLLPLVLIKVLRTFLGKDDKPPGPISFPFVGNLPQILFYTLYHEDPGYNLIAKKYGPLMTLGIGMREFVMVSSLDAMDDVIHNPDNLGPYMLPIMPTGKDETLVNTKALKTFMSNRFPQIEASIQEEIRPFILSMDTEAVWEMWTSIPRQFTLITMNILYRFLNGMSFDKDGDYERLEKLLVIYQDLVDQTNHWRKEFLFPFLQTKAKNNLPEQDTFNELKKFYLERTNIGNQYNPNTTFYVHALFDSFASENEDEHFHEQRVNIIAQELFLNGTETLSSALKWTIIYLGRFPEQQDKCYEEIAQVIGKDRTAESKDADKLTRTIATMCEIMRMANPLPYAGIRKAARDFAVGKYRITKGSAILFNVGSMFQNPRTFPEPETFKPERFLCTGVTGEPILTEDAFRVRSIFDNGLSCVSGVSFTWNTLFLFTVAMIQTYRFSFPMEPDLTPGTGPTNCPKIFSVNAVKRGREVAIPPRKPDPDFERGFEESE